MWLWTYLRRKKLSNKEWWSKYNEYLNSSAWKKKREKVLKRDNYKCQYKTLWFFKCGSKKELQVHHKTYKRVFNESLSDLVTLCKHHHEVTHKKKK